jgi:hypothetical protein
MPGIRRVRRPDALVSTFPGGRITRVRVANHAVTAAASEAES